jgi:hypothetical protein
MRAVTDKIVVGGVLADTGITTSLIWQLRKAKSMYVHLEHCYLSSL